MFQRRHQKRPEPALALLDGVEKVPPQQPREELLRQVLRVVRAIAFAANVGVERIPIGAAEPLQGFTRLGRFYAPSLQNDAPMGRRKPGLAAWHRI